MLFNAPLFLFLFLPVTLVAYYAANRFIGWQAAMITLLALSVAFYGNWNPPDLVLLTMSILFNYFAGEMIARTKSQAWIIFGIAANLLLLAVFKYSDFAISNINVIAGTNFEAWKLALPLGISFYTFTQIAFLVDRRRGEAEPGNLFNYALFVVFFPHLIAGPIVHAAKLLPQFREPNRARRIADNLAVGFSIFLLGLGKKVLIADFFAEAATETFAAAAAGHSPSFAEAWFAALCYTMQIYFDFSGYSDMAIGLSRMFGIDLPINFNSPYKATSIIDFWRRWHITLSQFLRDYLYIPLGGNRLGKARRYVNVVIVMLLGGLWHGANWTFVIWGAIHGTALLLNHVIIDRFNGVRQAAQPALYKIGGWLVTFTIVVVAWVFFRADNMETADRILTGMFDPSTFGTIEKPERLLALAAALAWVLILPNTAQLFAREMDTYYLKLARIQPIGENSFLQRMVWNARKAEAMALGLLSAVIVLSLWRYSEFIYFQF